MSNVKIGERTIGRGQPTYIVGEIGINHNGDLDVALKLMKIAAEAGCDAVKFQKRTPEICVPKDQQGILRQTPWGEMTYLDYRYRVEFGHEEYGEIARQAAELGIQWFASPWDEPSVDFLEEHDVPAHKVASASLTDHGLLSRIRSTGKPVILSTGMSTLQEIRKAVEILGTENLVVCHSTSTYPCPPEQLNLRMIQTLKEEFPQVPIGYSGHEVGLPTTVAAVALGATIVERHITLDRAMWGSDHAASIEPLGLQRLCGYIRTLEKAFGDGEKRVYDTEKLVMAKLRRRHN